MSSTKQVEEPQSTETTAELPGRAAETAAAPEGTRKKARAGHAADEPAKAPKPAAKKKPAKAVEEEKPALARSRPAAAVRPSIYEDITAHAKKLEAERAAKAAAHKATAATQSAATRAAANAQPVKRPASPFLGTSVGRTTPPAPRPAEVEPPMPAAESSAAGEPTAPAAPEAVSGIEAPAAVAGVAAPTAAASQAPDTTLVPATHEADTKTAAAEGPTPAAATPLTPKVKSIVPAAPAKTTEAKTETGTAPKIQPPSAKPATGPAKTGIQKAPVVTKPATGSTRPLLSGIPAPGTIMPPTPPRVQSARDAQSRPPSGQQGARRPSQPSRGPQGQPSRSGHRGGARQLVASAPKPEAPVLPVRTGPVVVPAIIAVRDFAELLGISVGDMLKKLMTMGIFATINQSLDYDTASLIAEEFEIKTVKVDAAAANTEAKPSTLRAAADAAHGEQRPPIVTVMGHVDHGKTSLLDAIRNAKVAAGEAGGITQHIGAYQVDKQGRKITFLDTPGHEAFTSMRARGAQVTDVAVLVVAADDGVMPQTIEAINHARAANVPIVVALNKIDRETADPARTIRQLSEHNVVVEEWGGDVPMVRVSARKMIGIDELLDMILLVADLAEHRADAKLPAVGTVVEAEMDRSRGPVATLLVQNGTLRQNDYLVIGSIQGRIRAMFDDLGNRIDEAGPSAPAFVLGLPSVPEAGTTFQVVADERTARTLAEKAAGASLTQSAGAAKALSLDDLYAQMQAGKMHELNLVLKADVQGSLEPIVNSLAKLSTESLKVRILHQGLGNISESDVSLAVASSAIVIGFNVETDPATRRMAAMEGVDVREYSIIYKLIEDVDKALKGLLEPTFKEVIGGRVAVRQVFKVNKRTVAGSYVTEGKATRTGQVRVQRAGKTVFDGRIASLKRFTEDAREVLTGFECGVMLDGFEDVHVGDILEFYHKEKEE
jgi:translation initiation factor IF-2